jgi:hypothetical protein
MANSPRDKLPLAGTAFAVPERLIKIVFDILFFS